MPVAANSQDQLRDTIWPEIGKWHRQLPEDLLAVGFTAVEEIELIRISTAKVPSPLRHLASMTSMQSLPLERDLGHENQARATGSPSDIRAVPSTFGSDKPGRCPVLHQRCEARRRRDTGASRLRYLDLPQAGMQLGQTRYSI